MTLSDKALCGACGLRGCDCDDWKEWRIVYSEEDVKQFIKDLKKRLNKGLDGIAKVTGVRGNFDEVIDELAGDDLI